VDAREFGIARIYGFVFGITYLGVALTEVLLGANGWRADGNVILEATPIQNAVHWLVGATVLVSALIGETAARMVARVIGIVFVVLTVWGFIDRDSLGTVLGFDGPLPWSYNIVHLITAIAALFAGFAASRAYGRETSAGSDLRHAA
jgi:hypothetical protein